MQNRNSEQLIGPAQPLGPEALVIVLIGASAVGKSTIAEHLCNTGVVEATPTWTTRPPRQGELDTTYDHHFVTDAAFDQQSKIDGFIDEKAFYGARYGLPFPSKPPTDHEALMVLKPVFMPMLIKYFRHARIYQIEASSRILPGRMKERGQSRQDIDERMRHHAAETAAARHFAHATFDNNGPLELTIRQVEAQIRTDREAYDSSAIAV